MFENKWYGYSVIHIDWSANLNNLDEHVIEYAISADTRLLSKLSEGHSIGLIYAMITRLYSGHLITWTPLQPYHLAPLFSFLYLVSIP